MTDEELKALQEACALVLHSHVFTEPLRVAKLPVGHTSMGGKKNGYEFSAVRTLPRESLLFILERGMPKIQEEAKEAQQRLEKAQALVDQLKTAE